MVFSTSSNAEENFQIYPDTQVAINNAVNQNEVNQSYLDDVVELFNKEIHTNSDDLNRFLIDALSKSIASNQKTNDELQLANQAEEELQQKNAVDITSDSSTKSSTAEDIYALGIDFVRSRGCPQTANYMLFAKVPHPSTCYSRNDEWARKCALNSALFSEIEPRFQAEILGTGKPYGTISGSFDYTIDNSSLDQYTALHSVNYSVTFSKQNVGYSAVYNITDVYDFDWGRYDTFEIGFGNNYCYAMQVLGLIKPFKISIVYNM